MTEYIKVTVQATEPNVINVASSQTTPNLKVTIDPTEQNAKLSRDWAIGEGLIQNEDYSSKTWAAESKSSADLSKMYSEAASLDLNNLENKIIEYDEQLNTTITEGVETIETLQANFIAEITTNKESALSDIDINKTNTLAQISTLANTSISDINAVGKSYDNLTYRNITNCLLEVPQRIKYTLEGGTLTIKAGSVVIVPYGTEDLTSQYPAGTTFLNDNFKVYDTQFTDGKFFVWAELVNDISHQQSTTEVATRFISMNINMENSVPFAFNVYTSSGATAPPTTQAYQWYDTTNNKCVHTDKTTGNISLTLLSLPFGIVTSTETEVFGSIDQVFNGIGYIGSAKWIDKGVKMLCSDGKNEDGTYKNTEYTTPNLKFYFGGTAQTTYHAFYNIADTYLTTVAISQEKYTFDVNSLSEISIEKHVYAIAYVRPENRFYVHQVNTTDWEPMVACKIDTHTNLDTNGNVGSFNPKQPFRAVDYNDKSEISGWGMPSSKYIDLTLGASGTTYTAPANGWFFVNKKGNALHQYFWLQNNTKMIALRSSCSDGATDNCLVLIPVEKGDIVQAIYTTAGTLVRFRFYYAVGSESEAQ